MTDQNLGEIEKVLLEKLTEKISNDFPSFMKIIFKDGEVKEILEFKKQLADIALKVDEQKTNLKKAIEDYSTERNVFSFTSFHYRDRAQTLLSSQITDAGNIRYQNLRNLLTEYKENVDEQSRILKEIYEKMIVFQKNLSSQLGLEIILVHTLGNSFIKQSYLGQEDVLKLLRMNTDRTASLAFKSVQKAKKDTEELNEEKVLINTILKSLEKLKEPDKEKMKEGLKNEETTYENILKNYNSKARIILWFVDNYWQKEKVSNRGPIEEARQRFLFQIHQAEIYELFQSGLQNIKIGANTVVRGGTGRVSSKKRELITDEERLLNIWIHHFVRSEQGIVSVDNRSGLIVDDIVLETSKMLEDVKTLLGVGNNSQYVSIAAKTGESRFAGYEPFFKIVEFLNGIQEKEIPLDKNNIESFLKKNYFQDGERITKTVIKETKKKVKKIHKNNGFTTDNS